MAHNYGRPQVYIDFPGKVTVNALIDTGAQRSVLDLAYFKRIVRSSDEVINLDPTRSQLTSVTGNAVQLHGTSLLPLRLHDRILDHRFFIMENLRSECILGVDFVGKHGLVLDVAQGEVGWPSPAREKLPATGQKDKTLVYPLHSVTVAPRTKLPISIKTEKPLTGNLLFLPNFPYAVESLISTDQSAQKILISNVTDFPLHLKCTNPVGEVELCEILALEDLKTVIPETPSKRKNWLQKLRNRPDLSQLNLKNVPEAHKTNYRRLITRFHDIFSKNAYDVGHATVLPQNITLKNPSLISATPPYRIPEHLKPVAVDFIRNLAEASILQPSTSPFSSPLMLIRKGDANPSKPLLEQYRVVHDYRRLNDNTVRDSYPMRHLYELLDSVSRAQVWSVLDLSSGFWNQTLAPSSRPYTAFGLPGLGHWEYTRSAQGLTNSPAAFQRLLDYVLRGINGVYVYIDDVIVCSDTHEEHLVIMEKVFQRFKQYKLKLKMSKIQLGAAEVNYLGYNLSRDHGIRAGAAKIQAVRDWPLPTSVTEIKQFHGLCSFFRRTIPNFATIVDPLISLTRKTSKWRPPELPEEAKEAFKNLKEALCA